MSVVYNITVMYVCVMSSITMLLVTCHIRKISHCRNVSHSLVISHNNDVLQYH